MEHILIIGPEEVFDLCNGDASVEIPEGLPRDVKKIREMMSKRASAVLGADTMMKAVQSDWKGETQEILQIYWRLRGWLNNQSEIDRESVIVRTLFALFQKTFSNRPLYIDPEKSIDEQKEEAESSIVMSGEARIELIRQEVLTELCL